MTKIVALMAVVFFFSFLFQKSVAVSTEHKTTVQEMLDGYQKGGKLVSHHRCEAEKVSVKKYSARTYTLLIVNNETDGSAIYLFTDEQGDSKNGGIQHFQKSHHAVGFDIESISEKKWVEGLLRMSPNLYKYIAKTQRRLSDTTPDEHYKNDCVVIDVGQEKPKTETVLPFYP